MLSCAIALLSLVPMETTNEREEEKHVITEREEAANRRFLHGFRLGYMFLMNEDRAVDGEPSLADQYGIKSPHFFLIGYEITWRMIGHSWLNVLLVINATISGLEQSKVFPSGNALLGFEIDNSFQVGIGINAMPTRQKTAHMIVAAGWTPRIGTFYLPVHAIFVPDVDGQHRTGLTVGVNW